MLVKFPPVGWINSYREPSGRIFVGRPAISRSDSVKRADIMSAFHGDKLVSRARFVLKEGVNRSFHFPLQFD